MCTPPIGDRLVLRPAFSAALAGFLGPSVANSRQHSTCQAQAASMLDLADEQQGRPRCGFLPSSCLSPADPHRLGVAEFANTEVRQLTPVPRVFHSTERQVGV